MGGRVRAIQMQYHLLPGCPKQHLMLVCQHYMRVRISPLLGAQEATAGVVYMKRKVPVKPLSPWKTTALKVPILFCLRKQAVGVQCHLASPAGVAWPDRVEALNPVCMAAGCRRGADSVAMVVRRG
jgi:hypothetical protein